MNDEVARPSLLERTNERGLLHDAGTGSDDDTYVLSQVFRLQSLNRVARHRQAPFPQTVVTGRSIPRAWPSVRRISARLKRCDTYLAARSCISARTAAFSYREMMASAIASGLSGGTAKPPPDSSRAA